MSKRYPGGLITKNPNINPTPEGGASGIWTLDQAILYQQLGTWPSATDPYFNQTTLLLHGDGTNGAQNNTFLDSSTNTFTITRNGNTTQGTFSPFSNVDGEWSNYFDGTGDYLSIASNADFAYGTGDFTWEAWVYRTTTTDDSLYTTMVADGFIVHIISGNVIVRRFGVADLITSSATVSANTWTHIAVARSGTTLSLWINGSRSSGGTTTNSTNFTQNGVRIGINDIDTNLLVGYLSNLRSIKGTAIYDPTSTTITVPTAPLTAVSGTELLTCQSNRFKDNSTNNFAITVNGNPSVQPFSPFAPSAAYSASVNGGSGYFDGSGDYLTAADSASWAFGAGNFTVEGWVYRTVGSASQFLFIQSDNSTAPGTSFFVEINSSNKLNSSVYYNSSSSINITSTADVPINAWTHFALVRTSGTISQYINGVRDGTNGTLSTNSLNDPAQALGIAARNNGGNPVTGYFSSARIIKGTGPYDATSSTLTIPTAPLTAISGTELLLNFTNAGIFDNTGKNNLETVGNAQIDTTTKKYGTGSMEFDGTGDYLKMSSNPSFNLSTGSFTLECWCNKTGAGGYSDGVGNVLMYIGDGSNNAAWLGITDSGTIIGKIAYNGSVWVSEISGGSVSNGTWNHVALVRNGSAVDLYLNGTSIANTTNSTNLSTYGSAASLGDNLGSGRTFNGFIDDARITKGVARYTANFTPPGGPFQNS